MPPFSIITPTFNARERINKTLDSVLIQDRSLFEYVVVDGGSTDGTVECVLERDAGIKIISGPDHGLYDAMNKGIENSSGRYLYFIGAGDTLHPDVLGEIASVLPSHDRGLVYGNFHLPDDSTDYYGPVSKWFLLFVYNICHQSAFYGREIFDLLGPYDLRYRIRADYAINVSAFCDSRIEKRYIDLLIADYAADGVSSLTEDEVFTQDFPNLARRSLGWSPLWTPDPFFSFLMRCRFNSSFREFGRTLFQSYQTLKAGLLQ
jgi:glycosyltransferase involved in cell wall biosynthesis